MPSKIFLRGDSDPIWLMLAADEALSAIEQAQAAKARFVRLDMPPWTRDDAPRPAYFDPNQVAAVLPIDPREYEHELDNPPEWT